MRPILSFFALLVISAHALASRDRISSADGTSGLKQALTQRFLPIVKWVFGAIRR